MTQDYGLWSLVVLNSALMIAFGLSFFHPRTKRDWRAMSGYSAFIVALFAEMYGAPLTVYLLAGWLGERFPALQATHSGGHLWNDLIGWQADPHISPFHLASYVLIGGGFWLIAAAWQVLHRAAQAGVLATTGPYSWLRHPQYLGFLLVMAGWLLQWPTIPTLAMFPVLAWVYARLARSEEREVAREFGTAWAAYSDRVRAYKPARPFLAPPASVASGREGESRPAQNWSSGHSGASALCAMPGVAHELSPCTPSAKVRVASLRRSRTSARSPAFMPALSCQDPDPRQDPSRADWCQVRRPTRLASTAPSAEPGRPADRRSGRSR